MIPERIEGAGWLVLIGGGEFSFEETEAVDAAWLAKTPADSEVGFVPAASGSDDYGRHFAVYLDEYFERSCDILPVYRGRDARRGKNIQRIEQAGAVYLGGGVPDHLLDTLRGDDGKGSPVLDALRGKIESGGIVVAIAGVAQACGHAVRSLFGGKTIVGLGWLPHGVVEPNFEDGNERRLRQLLEFPGVRWGLAIPAGSAVLLGPSGAVEVVGEAWLATDPTADLIPLESTPAPN
jgi:cyanophycinase-like exopeptidase